MSGRKTVPFIEPDPEIEPFMTFLAESLIRKIPASKVSEFRRRLQTGIKELSVAGDGEYIDIADGCSGTGIFGSFLNAVFWGSMSVMDTKVPTIRYKMAAENHKAKQSFLLNHHCDLELLLPDIQQLKQSTVTDVRSPHVPVMPPAT